MGKTSKVGFLEVPAYFMVPDGKGHWESESPMRFYSKALDYTITVPEGSVNDLASIPWVLRRVFAVNGPHRPAAALHDYLYETKGLSGFFTRKECDEVFLEAMLAPKINYWKALPVAQQKTLESKGFFTIFNSPQPLVTPLTAKLMYLGVRIGGGSHFR